MRTGPLFPMLVAGAVACGDVAAPGSPEDAGSVAQARAGRLGKVAFSVSPVIAWIRWPVRIIGGDHHQHGEPAAPLPAHLRLQEARG